MRQARHDNEKVGSIPVRAIEQGGSIYTGEMT
jgi:hypothetical protein